MIEQPTARRRWWQAFGPWPLRPGLLMGVGLMYYFVYQAGAQGNIPLLAPQSLRNTVLHGVVAALLIYLVARLGRAWQVRHGVHWISYLFVIASFGLIALGLRKIGFIPIALDGFGPNLVAYLRLTASFLVTRAVAGLVVDRLERQIAATEAALDVARQQQVQLIKADEEARRQISLLLHDRVQAGLLATCIELGMLAKRIPPDERRLLGEHIKRLDNLRSIDVRGAARALSPNLEDVGLRTVIEDLTVQYDAAFTIDVIIDKQTETDLLESAPTTALAVYRIVDQALLNVAAHARATQVSVVVTRAVDGIDVTIRDDGTGCPDDPTPGLGSTIITTWARVTGGTWSMRRCESGRGTVVHASLGQEPVATR